MPAYRPRPEWWRWMPAQGQARSLAAFPAGSARKRLWAQPVSLLAGTVAPGWSSFGHVPKETQGGRLRAEKRAAAAVGQRNWGGRTCVYSVLLICMRRGEQFRCGNATIVLHIRRDRAAFRTGARISSQRRMKRKAEAKKYPQRSSSSRAAMNGRPDFCCPKLWDT